MTFPLMLRPVKNLYMIYGGLWIHVYICMIVFEVIMSDCMNFQNSTSHTFYVDRELYTPVFLYIPLVGRISS